MKWLFVDQETWRSLEAEQKNQVLQEWVNRIGDSLFPCIVQDEKTSKVLMLGYQNRESIQATLSQDFVVFWSRSRQTLWLKGETSGHHLEWRSCHWDCDQDAFLIKAFPKGPTCHLGSSSCFFGDGACGILAHLAAVIDERKRNGGDSSYTAHLMSAGISRMAQKVGEEGLEVALAAVQATDVHGAHQVLEESADLIFHLLVLLRSLDLDWEGVLQVLEKRRKKSPN